MSAISNRGSEHASLVILIAAIILSLLAPTAKANDGYQEAEVIPQGQPIRIQEQQQEPIKVIIVKPEPVPVDNRVTFNPLGILLGVGSVNYERRLSDHISVEISPSFLYWGWDGNDTVGGGLGLGVNYYLKPKALRGLHFNLSVLGGDVSSEGTNTYLISGKALVRYNWVWDSGFTLGLGGGIQYTHLGFDTLESSMNGVLPAVSFNIGYAW